MGLVAFCKLPNDVVELFKEALTRGNKSTLREKKLYQRQPVFVSFPVTKPVVTQGTTWYQMKDMDIIFPMIPHEFVQVEGFGHHSPTKLSNKAERV